MAMHFNALKHPCMLIVILGDCAIETKCEFQMVDFLPEKLLAKQENCSQNAEKANGILTNRRIDQQTDRHSDL